MKLRNILPILFVFTLCSCFDALFEKEIPPHDLVAESAITNESSAQTALNGIYSYMQSVGVMSAYYVADNEYRLGILEGTYRGSFEEESLLQFMITEEESYVLDPWSLSYKAIDAANNFIFYVDKLSENLFGPNRKQEMIGEAKFLRAFFYAALLRKYGYFWDRSSKYGVINRYQPSNLSNNSMPRSSVEECYVAIFADLDEAIALAPTYHSCYRGCREAAMALKADLLLDRGRVEDFELAIRLVDELIAKKVFQLEDEFVDIFNNGYESNELIFTRHLKNPPKMDDNVGSLFKLYGGGVYYPSKTYYEFVDSVADPRFGVTIDSLLLGTGSAAKMKLIWKKHYVESGDCPMYYLRLGQMYLTKAEAMFHLERPKSDILEVLNILRDRAKMVELETSDVSNRDELALEIMGEYIRELAGENGAAYYAAIRLKYGNERMLSILNPNWDNDNQLCYPIPVAEREHNFEVEQKPL